MHRENESREEEQRPRDAKMGTQNGKEKDVRQRGEKMP